MNTKTEPSWIDIICAFATLPMILVGLLIGAICGAFREGFRTGIRDYDALMRRMDQHPALDQPDNPCNPPQP